LTKAALAEAVGVSTRMVTAYERGEKEPSQRTIAKLSQVLRFPVEFFSGPGLDEPPMDGASFRALSNLTARQRDQALGSGALALAFSDWIEARFRLPEPDVPQHQGIDPETAAMAVRSEWGLGERPIRNMVHLLEAHGVRVFSLTTDSAAMDAFSFRRGNLLYVFLDTMKSAERSRMDAAHELGHLVLHWKGGARGRDCEREADLFGSAFLMPRGSVLAEAPRGGRLDQIIKAKRHWKVSVANLTYRMHGLGLLSDWQYRTLFIEISQKGYRTHEPDGTQRETSQMLAKVFQMLRDEGVTMGQIAYELRVLPDELSNMIFGLILTPIDGSGNSPQDRGSEDRPKLHLI